jgi:amidohydrolase
MPHLFLCDRLAATVVYTVLCLTICSFGFPAGSMADQPAQQTARAQPTQQPASRDAIFERDIAAMFDELVNTRRELHRFPELSNQEERTARFIALQLKEWGLSVQTGVGGHGVVALLEGTAASPRGSGGQAEAARKCVAIRADMDALPIMEADDRPYRSEIAGVMHACGHDVHVTCALGTARLLAKHRDRVAGTVKFIFQGAEEGMPVTYTDDWGAKLMVAQGALENPRPAAIFALHCTPLAIPAEGAGQGSDRSLELGNIGYCVGPTSANSDRFRIVIRGKVAHGSAPHKGVDAIAVAGQAINALQLIHSRHVNTLDPLVITIGTIEGGSRENIIADKVELTGTVRTYNIELQDRVIEMMHRTLQGVTEAHGANYELEYRKGYPSIINDRSLTEFSVATLRRLRGNDRVVHTVASMGGEDFSYFSQVVPGFYFKLGVANVDKGIIAGVHTADFDVDERCLAIGVESMAALVCDFLDQ